RSYLDLRKDAACLIPRRLGFKDCTDGFSRSAPDSNLTTNEVERASWLHIQAGLSAAGTPSHSAVPAWLNRRRRKARSVPCNAVSPSLGCLTARPREQRRMSH